MENVTLKSTYKFDDKFRAYSAKLYDIVQHLKTIRLGLVDNYSCNDDEKFAAKVLFEEALMELNEREENSPHITEYYSEADHLNSVYIDLIKMEKGSEITNLTIDLLDHWHKIKRSIDVWNDSSLYTKKLEEFKRKSTEKEQRELEEARQQLNNLAQQINQQHGGQPQQQAQAGAGYPPFTTGDVSNNTSPNISNPLTIPVSHTLAAINDAITMTPVEESKVKVTSSETPTDAKLYPVGDLLNNNIKHIPELVSNWGMIPTAMQESLKLPLSIAVEHLWQKQKKGNVSVGKFKIQDTNLRYNNFVLESENGQDQIQIIHCRPGEYKINIKSDIPLEEEPSTQQTSTEQVETKTSKTSKAKTKKATETKPETKATETKESTAN